MQSSPPNNPSSRWDDPGSHDGQEPQNGRFRWKRQEHRSQRYRRRGIRRHIWNLFVMVVGNATIGLFLVRGVIYLLVLAEGWINK